MDPSGHWPGHGEPIREPQTVNVRAQSRVQTHDFIRNTLMSKILAKLYYLSF
jgi:hypothetical protein